MYSNEVMRLISLYETMYFDFTVKHFHEKLPEHGFRLGYCMENLSSSSCIRRVTERAFRDDKCCIHKKQEKQDNPIDYSYPFKQ